MPAPLDGIRVLEVANWLAAPAAGALLADLGADVIKVEPPGGEVFREFLLRSLGYSYDFATNYAFQLDNRGKRSITVALDQPSRHQRTHPANPIWNSYQAGCGAWILLVMPQPDPYWPRFCEMIGRPEWAQDPRFTSLHGRRQHSVELTREIEARFAAHDLPHWALLLDRFGLIWAPVATLTDVIDDPQAREMGWFTTLEHPTLGRFETLDTPFKIYGSDVGARGPAPEAGAHTFDVLAELGVSDEELAQLAADGVI